MRVLFNNGTPRGNAKALSEHEVQEARDFGWDRLGNGELLKAAEAAGFEVLLTNDKNLPSQQNLKGRKIAIVVLGNSQWPVVRLYLNQVADAVNTATPGSLRLVDIPQER